jgi:hypothetical protein
MSSLQLAQVLEITSLLARYPNVRHGHRTWVGEIYGGNSRQGGGVRVPGMWLLFRDPYLDSKLVTDLYLTHTPRHDAGWANAQAALSRKTRWTRISQGFENFFEVISA